MTLPSTPESSASVGAELTTDPTLSEPAVAVPATTSDTNETEATPSFADLGLHPALVASLTEGGYTSPTPIQGQTIPPLLRGQDVVGQAQTGTGKTAAFSLPLIQGLDINRRDVQGLVLCPTRELALQVSEAIRTYGAQRRVRVLTVYGGAPINKQLSKLRAGIHVVVGTPGRVKDVIKRRALDLSTVRKVVLDEADEMLRMGFIEDVKEILAEAPEERQTALFSATMPQVIRDVAEEYLTNPLQVKLTPRKRTVERIEQRVILTHASDKTDILARIIEAEPSDAVLVFARTRASCAQLVDELRARGVLAAALHGDLSQDQRETIVARLRSRKIQLVVATDVAARGLDVEGITHVVNYDPPIEPEVYVHRIGRTGRAGRDGVSILMLTPREQRVQKRLEFYTGQRMSPMRVPTNQEILASRTADFAAKVKKSVANGRLQPYLQFIDELLEDHGLHSEADAKLRQFAAALARLASKERPLELHGHEPKALATRPPFRGDDRGRPSGGGPGRPGRDRARTGSWTKLFLPLGQQAGLQPRDVVGAIANEAGVPGSAVGGIDIRERVCFVEVSSEHADKVLQKLERVTIRGRAAGFVRARPERFPRSGDSRPGGDSKASGRRPGKFQRSRPGKHRGKFHAEDGKPGRRGRSSYPKDRPSAGKRASFKRPHRGRPGPSEDL